MTYLISAILFLLTVTGSYAADRVTPYGDYSQWCSAYGTCRENLGPKQAERAIAGYFESKGLRAANMKHRERFIEAEIYRDNRLVDRVLFDRKTGRIRSTY